MRYIIILIYLIASSQNIFGQIKQVKGTLSTLDTADLTILNIYPDSFPNVSVLFKAEKSNGIPLWGLTKEKMIVMENSQACNVISLEPVSKNKAIILGIVIDHSGSMQEDYSQLYDENGKALYSYDKNYQIIFPKGYTSPIKNAKSAVKNFVSTFNIEKDFISVIGFSDSIDFKISLTQDTNKINTLIDSMEADYSTALYDAMIESLDEIKNTDGVKILIALTDGQDNSSKSKWYEVVTKANAEKIPTYIVGLGNANVDTLTLIAENTNGKFTFTQSSNSLDTIYTEISQQVQAFYNLVYQSTNFSSVDSTRQIELAFDIDSIYLETNVQSANYPVELIEFMARKEKKRQYKLYGGVAIAIIISLGTLLFFYQKTKKNKQKPTIKELFPNPSNGIINLNYKSGIGKLQIINMSGQLAKIIDIDGVKSQFDLTSLPNGNYLAIIQSNGQTSNSFKFILQR